MKLDVTTLEGANAGSVELDEAIFGLEPREDLIARCIRWQLAKRRAGTHAVKNRSDINRTTRKVYKQKGTGSARHGAASAPQFRGGGRAFGPQVRSHAHDLPKKVRALALRHALSAKAKDSSWAASPPAGAVTLTGRDWPGSPATSTVQLRVALSASARSTAIPL